MSKYKQQEIIPMPELGEGYQLEITTDKHYQYAQIDSVASVCQIEKRDGYSMKKHAIYSDYYQRVAGKPCKRVTAKQIDDIHQQATALIEDIKALAIDHYSKKG